MTTSPTSPTPPAPTGPPPLADRISILGQLLAGTIRIGESDLIESCIREMRANLDQAELDVRGLQSDPEAELAPTTAGILAPTSDDCVAAFEAAQRSGWHPPMGATRAMLDAFAGRLAERISFPGPAATCPHDDITGNRCEGCGSPVVIQRALSLADLKAEAGGVDGMFRAHLTPPTNTEIDALVRLWDALPGGLSQPGVVAALVGSWAAVRRGDATLPNLAGPAVRPDGTTPAAGR